MPLLLRSEEHTSELQSLRHLVCLFCLDRKSTRLNSSHLGISYAVFCLKKKHKTIRHLVCRLLLENAPRDTLKRCLAGQQRGRCASVLSIRRPPRSTLFPYFFFNDTATTEIYTLSLHDALPISIALQVGLLVAVCLLPL